MIETPTALGRDRRLIAIITEPDEKRPSAPTVLLLNAGLIHRVGPNRLNVVLARQLAELGFRSVRFDLSGVGDSERSPIDRPYEEQAVFDILEAIEDLAERAPADQFVTIGLCTGAYNALGAASEDERVTGCVFIDGYAYPTRKYQVRYQTKRVLQWWRWKRYIKRKLGIDQKPQIRNPYDELAFQPDELPRTEFENKVGSLLDRGANLHFVYTGYGPQPYNYEDQLFDLLPSVPRDSVGLLYIPDATHTFTRSDHREQLIDSITDWIDRSYPEAVAAGQGTQERESE